MRFPSFHASRALAACALLAFTFSAGASSARARQQQPAQDKDKKEIKVSDAESKLAEKIEKAPDAAAKFAAAEEFVKKFPKSQLRPQVVDYLAGQAFAPADNAQKIALAERLVKLLPEAGESGLVTPLLVNAYVAAERYDDAFRAGDAWLKRNPNDVRVLSVLSFHSINQAQRNNPKYVAQGQPYGPKAIELLEAGTKPADMTDADFQEFKGSWLPQLYQTQGLVALAAGNTADAFAKLQKAAALKPSDPLTFYLMGTARNEEYVKMATQHKSMPEGAQKTELMTKINAHLDEIIDHYAHTVALSEGMPVHEQLRAQVLQDMTSYYKFRKGSTAGMQELIDKYKQPAAPATPAATPTPAPATPPE